MRSRGFTLLEMMIAMAILSGSLTWLIVGMSRNLKAENHAKLMTTANFLARQKISEFEDELYEKGFGEFEKDIDGTFEDKGFARFTWQIVVDKVELPSSEQLQTVLTNAQQARQSLQGGNAPDPNASSSSSSSGQNGNPLSQSAGALASQFGIIKDVLEQGIRRVTVRVLWWEGRREQDVTVITYFTDVRKVDQAIQLSIPSNLGGAAGGATGTSGTSGTTSGTSSGTTGK
jgi:general secretion pathway protein I